MLRGLLSLALLLLLAAPQAASAQQRNILALSPGEMGRVIGAAAECKMNSNRAVMLTRRVLTAADRLNVNPMTVQNGINAGSEQVRRGRMPCNNARIDFEALEEALADLPPKPL
ncbi:hypothetical protein V6B08_18810 [Ferrovibrio sp. MS7]|jgi:hypothetical protein|uniref:hypothetical protein n=1 Tax=Ferrovibrio plantarum TaxID=3119164 RepID=UPI003136ACC0